jgi:aspartyl-tRNA(Asn)/glutamyl-tRNA(Gln) amidotransferase subunit A
VAPPIEDALIEVNGKRVEARANLGLFTQPLSFVGLPVVAAPLGLYEGLPLGIQLIGAPGSDRALLSFACGLERCGLLGAAVCPLPALASGAAR